GEEIGKIVTGFRQQCQRVGAQSGDDQEHDVAQGNEQGDAQDFGGLFSAGGAGVHVHALQVYGGGRKASRRSSAAFGGERDAFALQCSILCSGETFTTQGHEGFTKAD